MPQGCRQRIRGDLGAAVRHYAGSTACAVIEVRNTPAGSAPLRRLTRAPRGGLSALPMGKQFGELAAGHRRKAIHFCQIGDKRLSFTASPTIDDFEIFHPSRAVAGGASPPQQAQREISSGADQQPNGQSESEYDQRVEDFHRRLPLHRPGRRRSPGRRQGGRVDSLHRPNVPTVRPREKLCARIRRCASVSQHLPGPVRPSDSSIARFAGRHK